MKKSYSIFNFTLGLLLLAANISFSDGLNSVHTPDGVYIIAVGNNGLILRSSTSGDRWTSYTEPSVNFKSVHSFNNTVWLAGDNGKVYKALKTQTTLSSYNYGAINTVNSIFFINENVGFLCGDAGIVYKTINGGVNWTVSNSGISPTSKLNSISFKDADNGIVVGSSGVSYISADGGATWQTNVIPTTRSLLKVTYLADGIATVGEWGTLLLKPNASVWSSIETRINTDIRGISGLNLSEIHICGGGGFIRNNKNASSNFLNFEINPMLANLTDINFYNASMGFAVSGLNNVVIKTTNGGTSWQLPATATVNFSWVSRPGATGQSLGDNLCTHPVDRNTIFTAFSGRVYVSRDRGESWTQLGTQMPSTGRPHSFFVSPLDTSIWLCAVESSGADRVVRTTDYGQTWNTIVNMNFSNYGEPLQIDQNDPRIFYFAPDNGGFYKSVDNGATFTEISNNFPFRSPCDIMVTYDASNIIFLADGITSQGLGDLFKSTNTGVNWTRVFTNTTSSEIPSLSNTVFDNTLAWFTNWPGNNIYKSTNTGDNWTLFNTNTFSGWGSDVCKEDPNVIMTGSWNGNMSSLTTNGGISWNIIGGLTGSGGVMRLVERGYVVGQAGNNVYKLNITYSVITGVSENNTSLVPEDFSLKQNFPNPFNPSTIIKFGIPVSGNVSLKVYNELGKEINTLVNSFKNAGSYEITFDASDLPSGIYFYKLIVNEKSDTKKMLLIK